MGRLALRGILIVANGLLITLLLLGVLSPDYLWLAYLPTLGFGATGMGLLFMAWHKPKTLPLWMALCLTGLGILLAPYPAGFIEAHLLIEIGVVFSNFAGLAALLWVCYSYPDGALADVRQPGLWLGWLCLGVIVLGFDWGWLGFGLALCLALWHQRRRYLNTPDGLVRQQMRWMLFGLTTAIFSAIAFIVMALLSDLVLRENANLAAALLGMSLAVPGLLTLPASILIAILRYRLWDEARPLLPTQATLPSLVNEANPPNDVLTQRETEILRLVALGQSNQQIADALVISLNTVKRHMSNIYGKLGVTRRTEAVFQARQRQILPP